MDIKKLMTAGILNLSLASGARAAIVPCGGEGDPCKLCDLFVLLDNIIDFVLVDVVPPVAVIAFIIGGVYFFMSRGNPQSVTRANSILTTAVIGLLIVYGAYLVIGIFFSAIGVAEGEFGTNIKNWFEYPCE